MGFDFSGAQAEEPPQPQEVAMEPMDAMEPEPEPEPSPFAPDDQEWQEVRSHAVKPEQLSTEAQMAAKGRLSAVDLRAAMKRNPRLLDEILAINPKFNQNDIPRINRIATQYGSGGPGTLGGQRNSVNTLIHHTDLYLEAAKAIKNGDFKPGNSIYNKINTMFGGTGASSLDQLADVMATETGKLTSGGVPSDSETKRLREPLASYSSPDQMEKAGKNILAIMGGRAIPMMQTLKEVGLEESIPFLQPQAKEILHKHGINPDTIKPYEIRRNPENGKLYRKDESTGRWLPYNN